MTTYPFTPTSQGPFTFYPTLDGNPYTCIVTANLFANTPVTGRYYLNVYGQNNTLIVCLPVIESPVAIPLTSLTWDSNTGLAYGTSSAPLVSGANAMPGGVGATLEFTLLCGHAIWIQRHVPMLHPIADIVLISARN